MLAEKHTKISKSRHWKSVNSDAWNPGQRPTLEMTREEELLANKLYLAGRQSRLRNLLEQDENKYELELKKRNLALFKILE
jgi:hypothetical protein